MSNSTQSVWFQNLNGALKCSLNYSVIFNVPLKMTENEHCKALYGHSAIVVVESFKVEQKAAIIGELLAKKGTATRYKSLLRHSEMLLGLPD